jgi:hypothetical protein
LALVSSAGGTAAAVAAGAKSAACKPKLAFSLSLTGEAFPLALSTGPGAFAQAGAGVSAAISTGNGVNLAGVSLTGEFVAQAPRSGTFKQPGSGTWKLRPTAKLPRSRSSLLEVVVFDEITARNGGPTVAFELMPPTTLQPVTILESTGGVLTFGHHGRSGSFKLTLQSQTYPSVRADGSAVASGSWSCF